MKKKKLKNLSLNKTIISSFNKNDIKGGVALETGGLRCGVTENTDCPTRNLTCESIGPENCYSEKGGGCLTWWGCVTEGYGCPEIA